MTIYWKKNKNFICGHILIRSRGSRPLLKHPYTENKDAQYPSNPLSLNNSRFILMHWREVLVTLPTTPRNSELICMMPMLGMLSEDSSTDLDVQTVQDLEDNLFDDLDEGDMDFTCQTDIAAVVFLGKDNSELVMVPQTMYLRLHGW